MTKNQTTKITRVPTFDGRQITALDGLQMVTSGAQVSLEGLQMVARPQNSQNPGYGRQTSTPMTPQSSFAPASGPKIPPMKK